MMTICGNPRAREGRITFAGRDITELPTHEIARLKIAQAPEGRRIFVRMTVLENLQMGAALTDPAHFEADLARVFALLCGSRSASTSAAARSAASSRCWRSRADERRPRLLLLDEPSLACAIDRAADLRGDPQANSEEKLTVFLVEQNAFHAPEAWRTAAMSWSTG